MLEMAKNAQIMLEIEDYAFPFELCFSMQIMLKIMLAYCINAYQLEKSTKWSIRPKHDTKVRKERMEKVAF